MASKRFNGVLDSPIFGDFYDGKLRFTHLTTTGNVLAAAQSFESLVSGGVYDFMLNYGTVVIESKVNGGNWYTHGAYTVNSSTTATTLPALLLATTPVTPEIVQQIEALLADTEAARDAAEDAQASTEALFNGFDSSVAESLSLNSPASIDWDVEVDFVSGLVMKRGFGIESNGNNIVEFTRSTAREYINRSGVHQTAAVDKPAFSKAGISLYESMTNILLWSEDFSNAVWDKTNISVSQDGTLSSDGVTQAWLVEDTDAATRNSILQNPATDTDSQFVISVDIKRADSAQISVAYTSTQESFKTVGFNFDTETLSGNLAAYARVEKLANGWYRLHATSELSSGGAISSVRIYPVDSNLDAALGSVYVSKAQVAYKTIRCLPYQKTEGVSATTESDSASIPMMGNMPTQGLPFTIMFDIPSRSNREGSLTGTPFRNNVSATAANFYVSFGNPNNIYFNLGDGPFTTAPLVDSAMRVVLVFDGTNSTLYVNGVQGTSKPTSVNYNLNTDITFHPTHNSEIKNFRIAHRALTANEVKALGAAK